MHELSICTAIAKIAHQAAAGRTVERVRVDIGHLRQVVPDTLRHSWEMVVFGTPLDSVPLEVREVAAVIECRSLRHTHRARRSHLPLQRMRLDRHRGGQR